MPHRQIYNFLSLVLLCVFFSILAINKTYADEADLSKSHVSINLVAENKPLKPSGSIWLAIEQNINPHWHTYWKNPGDSGAPMDVKWSLPEGFKIDTLLWPVPQIIKVGPLVNFGYEGKATILARLHLPNNIPPEAIYDITADVEILVCKDICIPEYGTYTTRLYATPPVNIDKKETAKLFMDALSKMPSGKWPGSFTEVDGNFELTLNPDNKASFEYTTLIKDSFDIYFFPEEWGVIRYAAPQDLAKLDGDAAVINILRGKRPLAELEDLKGILTFRDSANQLYAIRIHAENAAPPVTTTSSPEQRSDEDTSKASSASSTGLIGFVIAIISALLGGLILNLMPCVFPVLSMKALSLCKLADKEESAARKNGLAYTAGILCSFGIIAIALIAIRAGGAQIGWGFQLQNPAFVLFLSYILFAVGLNLSGLFTIQGGKLANMGQALTTKGGLTGSFFTGVLATLVATPCTAPFMGAAMGYALTQPAFISLFVFLSLGLGLALPYLALSFIPALRTKLPRPGAWMDNFKHYMAFPMYASAAWLIWVYSNQTDSLSLLGALMGLVGIVFGIHLLAHHKKAISIISYIVLLLSLALPLAATNQLTPEHASPTNMAQAELAAGGAAQDFSSDRLEKALAGDNAVFVNMTADWCITCKVNEKVALKSQDVKDLFSAMNVIYFKGDWTNRNPEITQYLNQYNRQGVPIYVFYPARDKRTGKRGKEIVLPQILTPKIVIDTLNTHSNEET